MSAFVMSGLVYQVPCLVIGWEQRLWNDLPLGIPTPTSVPNLGHLRQGVGEGEFFENFQICKLELEDQNGGTPHG